jgi:hypothetical protein
MFFLEIFCDPKFVFPKDAFFGRLYFSLQTAQNSLFITFSSLNWPVQHLFSDLKFTSSRDRNKVLLFWNSFAYSFLNKKTEQYRLTLSLAARAGKKLPIT